MSEVNEYGVKVGDRFEVITDKSWFSKGDIVMLYEDDGSECSRFKAPYSRNGYWERYSRLRKIED